MSRLELLYFTVRKSTQLGPLAAVHPGYVGLPNGFVGVGWTPVSLNPVVVYESPLRDSQFLIAKDKEFVYVGFLQDESMLDSLPSRPVLCRPAAGLIGSCAH